MEKKIKRIYVDATIVLGHFDKDTARRKKTDVFWRAVQYKEVVVIASDVLDNEIQSEHARDFLATLPESQVIWIDTTNESIALAQKYIDGNVVSGGNQNDCNHVALATIHADGVVSWNMSDMVRKKKRYNTVNEENGYPKIKIVTPNKYKEIPYEKK